MNDAAAPTTREERKQRDADLWDVFRDQEDAGELLLYRACFFIAVSGAALPLISSLLSGEYIRNVPFFILTGFYAAWFGLAVYLRRRNLQVGIARAVSVFMFGLIPWSIMGAYVSLLGILRAIGVWEPIIFFTAMCVLSIIWARPFIPLVLGGVGATCYLGMWFLSVPPSTWGELDQSGPLVPHITAYRAILLGFVALVCWWGARRFRAAVLEGARALRARDLFGKYRLHDALGHGGMGSVVKATYCPEGGFERPVAIKRVLEHIAQKSDVIEQFRAEAELGSRLQHPNIVAVLDFGRVDKEYFFAMEYVDGPSLHQVISRARKSRYPLPSTFVARVGADICAALRFAHEDAVDSDGRPLRVVHRDLCPANILLSRAGTVKLTDFGIARTLGDAEEEQTGTVVGKVAYMAPELLTREAFDARADVFSLGVVLWEMLAGEKLSGRSRHRAAALAVVQEDLPMPSSLRPELDPLWDDICARCLENEVADRYQSARELLEDLLVVLRDAQDADGHEVHRVLEELRGRTGKRWRGIEDDDPSASESAETGTRKTGGDGTAAMTGGPWQPSEPTGDLSEPTERWVADDDEPSG